MQKAKQYVLVQEGYIEPLNCENAVYIPYNYKDKTIDQHVADIAAELGLEEWFTITLAGSYFTSCYTSSKKGIHLLNIPNNNVARIDLDWYNEPILLFAGKEEDAGLNYESLWTKPQEVDPQPAPAYSGITEAERRQKEREWDDLYNEGGEGYNPYRLPKIEPIIEPQDI